MAKKKFSDLPATTSIGASDLLATSQVDADAQSGYTSKKITGGNVARSINAGIEYPTDLETEDKTIIGAVNEINSKALAIDSASGDIASFDTAISAPLVSLSTTIIARGGGGTPSTPIPIVGYSEVKPTRCGVNFWDEQWEVGSIQVSSGEPSIDNTSWRSKNFIAVGSDINYHWHKGGNANATAIYFYDAEQNYINYLWISASQSADINFTTPANCCYIKFVLFQAESGYGMTYNNNISINYPSSDTTYHAYNGQKIPLSLGTTVYGGRLYFVNGWKCDVDPVINKVTLDGTENWSIFQSGTNTTAFYISSFKNDVKNTEEQYCSHFVYNQYAYQADAHENTFIQGTSGNLIIQVSNSLASTVEDFKSWLASEYSSNKPVEYRYITTATPFTIDLSSSNTLDAVVGKNNVFSDCGVTSLTFIDKMQHYVDKKIAELQALILQ